MNFMEKFNELANRTLVPIAKQIRESKTFWLLFVMEWLVAIPLFYLRRGMFNYFNTTF